MLARKAVVYVRQSTQAQVETNLERRRRQYELVDVARRRGFRTVEVIDEDLGRSASGLVVSGWWQRSAPETSGRLVEARVCDPCLPNAFATPSPQAEVG